MLVVYRPSHRKRRTCFSFHSGRKTTGGERKIDGGRVQLTISSLLPTLVIERFHGRLSRKQILLIHSYNDDTSDPNSRSICSSLATLSISKSSRSKELGSLNHEQHKLPIKIKTAVCVDTTVRDECAIKQHCKRRKCNPAN